MGQEEKREKEEVTYIIAQMSPNLNMEVAKNLKKFFSKYNVPIVMDSLVGSIESDMGIKAT